MPHLVLKDRVKVQVEVEREGKEGEVGGGDTREKLKSSLPGPSLSLGSSELNWFALGGAQPNRVGA